jgi:hypothetical protein
VGTDIPKGGGGGLTREFVAAKIKFRQLPKVPQWLGDGPCGGKGWKSGEIQVASGDWPHPKIKKKLTFELVAAEIQLKQIPKLPQGFGDAPYERDQKIGENKLVSGDWPAQKWKKN